MRRLTRRIVVIGGVAAAIACANRGGIGPPGGPVDKIPPHVDQITPESGSVSQRAGAVTFHFTRVVSDAPSRGALNQYFLISPTDGEPRVNWHRDHIDVRPRHGFRANTAYSVTLLPGLSDVRGNTMTEGATTVFSTGAVLPRFGIVGSIFDWAAERPAAGAIVEAISRPDSTLYIAASDSLGQYTLGPFEPGRFTVIGFIDKNNNRARDPGEQWDSVSVLVTTTRPVATLLAITRDTIPPRISAVTQQDSMTLRVTFDRALDPGMTVTPQFFRVQRSDSTEIPIASVIGARAATDSAARRDSLARRDTTVRRDTTGARVVAPPPGAPSSVVPVPAPRVPPRANPPRPGAPATATAPPPPRPPRPAPETAVLIALSPPATLAAGATYRITARDVRGLMGHATTSTRTLTIPKPPPPTARDSARRRDSTRLRDSTRVPPRRPTTVR